MSTPRPASRDLTAGERVGLILFAHGARDSAWAAPFEAVAAAVRRERPAVPVRLAYLELMPPDLAAAADELHAAGCTAVDVLPLFLGTGAHLRRDLPPLIDALRARHPDVRWTLHPAAGESPRLTQALCDIALATLPGAPEPAKGAP